MSAKNVILRKKVGDILHDLLPQTSFAQVINGNNKTLETVVAELTQSITAVDTRVSNLVQDAPEAYDTLKEIGQYIATHGDEYTALQALVGDKVTKEEGKGLSTNDFTNELKAKLDALYTKAQLDTKFEAVSANTSAIEKLNGDDTVEGSVDYKIKQAAGQAVEDVSTLKTDMTAAKAAIEKLNGDATTEGSVAKSVKDAVDPLTNETTGILAQAKAYTDTNGGKVILSETQPANMTENDLWIYTIPEQGA